jgi:hypothetical protein
MTFHSDEQEVNLEEILLRDLVSRASKEMERVLLDRMHRGKGGWNDPGNLPMLLESLHKHMVPNIDWETGKALIDPENMIDIMNIAAFLWNLTRKGGKSR